MNNYKFLYLFWLLPLYIGALFFQQVSVYYGITDTYENGNSYTAEVVDFEFKQIAAQTNGLSSFVSRQTREMKSNKNYHSLLRWRVSFRKRELYRYVINPEVRRK